ncbi:MAG: hypothetical protein NT105_10450 [Verrucomicrobia bacterium]|nr:hypothetical protein [Verrucomicrobiota bacterium]
MGTEVKKPRRFDIALSFPGEHREFVSKVAAVLAKASSKERILYDKFHEAEFARPDLDTYLPNLYRTKSELIVLFLCADYAKKRWCKLEWRFIRQLIATAEQHRIMFLSFDGIGAVPELGILDGDGYVPIGSRSAEEIAALIADRLRINKSRLSSSKKKRGTKMLPRPKPQPDDSRPPLLILHTAETADFAEVLSDQLGGLTPQLRLVPWLAGTEPLTDERRTELVGLINSAPVAACLLAPDYFKTILHQDLNIPDLLSCRHDGPNRPLLLLPVIVRTMALNHVRWTKGLRCFPSDLKPIRSKSNDECDAIFAELAEHISQKLQNEAFRLAPPPPSWPALPADRIRIERLPRTAEGPLGRGEDLDFLDSTWDEGQCNVLALVAGGGVGKTALINQWVEELSKENFRGAKRVFAWSFYSQGTGERVTSSDLFMDEALRWFGDVEVANNSNLAPVEKGHHLAVAIRKEKTLLLLDGMEPLQGSLGFEKGEIADAGLQAALRDLAKENSGLVIITTRERIEGLDVAGLQQKNLDQISREAVRALFRRAEIRGTDEEYDRVGGEFGFQALAIQLLTPYLRECPGRKVTFALEVPDLKNISDEDGRHPRRVMEFQAQRLAGSPELDLLQLLGLFDRIATSKEINALRTEKTVEGLNDHLRWQTEKQWEQTVTHLRALNLLSPPSHHDYDVTGRIIVVKDLRRVGALDAHPHIRKHFGERLRLRNEALWKEGHRILYRFLAGATEQFPATIQDLAPLYQAIAHGCQAGLYQEVCENVYFARVNRGTELYSLRKLCAFGSDLGSIAAFFKQPWRRMFPGLTNYWQAWLLIEVAVCLRALGRLSEALEPMQEGSDLLEKEEDWPDVAASVSNLSELELTLGMLEESVLNGVGVAGAMHDAEQSMAFADRSDNRFMQIYTRTTYADALHKAGRCDEALARFREAEAMQAKHDTRFLLLYSISGFRYCDLLLATSERAAWRETQKLEAKVRKSELIEECCAAERRAEQAAKSAEKERELVSLALDHLTLGRAALYRAILENSDLSHIDAAVDDLRRAASQDHIPSGLLTRAWLRFLTGARTGPESAQADLDEALEIAERGPMRLHMADIHLSRARLFGRLKAEGEMLKYPWNQNPDGTPRGPADDLAAAEKLIKECGYHRRDEELADAKKAILGGS